MVYANVAFILAHLELMFKFSGYTAGITLFSITLLLAMISVHAILREPVGLFESAQMAICVSMHIQSRKIK